MPVKPLPSNPDLDHLKYQARDLLKLHAAGDLAAAQRIREFHPRFRASTDAEIFAASLKLSDAQLTIARERGFTSWTRLREYIQRPSTFDNVNLPYHERIEDITLRRAVNLVDAGDVEELRLHLKEYPNLTHQHALFEGGNYFRTPTLLEFIAENPVRHGTLPDNIVEIAKVIVEAGVERAGLERSTLTETLGLVATGRVPRECHVQVPLIDLLCDYGANPNDALRAAALHGEHEAVNALIRRGARLDLPVAAALGRIHDFHRLLPIADIQDRHLALALASQFGHVEIVRLLLDAGEDPNRYNPISSHSHSTPLHQAALAGHESLVRLLVERGARLEMKDLIWQGTPADWAHHGGRLELETYLRAQQSLRDS
jgi:Ankyrin repeats (3 copies)